MDATASSAGLVLTDWFVVNRRAMPWRETADRADPYRVLVSESMLQQTRVSTVIPYYGRFLARFPDVEALASADEAEVMAQWKGLGYYSRARSLHRAARAVVRDHGGRLPEDYDALRRLPGVGDYTAGAVRSIAFGLPTPAVDGNVLRVLTRFAGIAEDVALPETKRRVADLSKAMCPPDRAADFCEGLMELGAVVCLPKAPECGACPWEDACRARAEGRTAELPVKRAKPAPEVTRRAVLVVRSGGRILVEYREKGLLGGLWGFPDREPVEVFEERSGVRPDLETERVAGVVDHVFTHRRWRMDVHVCRAVAGGTPTGSPISEAPRSDPPPAPTAGFRWVTESEFAELPVSKAFQKVWECARMIVAAEPPQAGPPSSVGRSKASDRRTFGRPV